MVQVKRLKMYNSGKAVRNKQGKIISQELQSKELPSTRIVPDRRWFGNTRVIGQKQLESFREQMADKANNPFTVLLRERKLPMQVGSLPAFLRPICHTLNLL
jgi:nuclear GTP-binding protein